MKACQPSNEEKRSAHDYPDGVKQEIRRRAFEIWEDRGRGEGKALDDWRRAEAEVMTHRVMRRAA